MNARKLILFGLLLVAAAGLALVRATGPGLVPSEQDSNAHPPPLGQRYLAQVDQRFSLPPDSRFVRAFSELERIITDSPSEPTEAERSGDGWLIRVGDREVSARLRAVPAFSDWLDVLDAWTGQLLTERPQAFPPGIESAGADRSLHWDDVALMRELHGVDAKWDEPASRASGSATVSRALAQLALLLTDDLQLADRVAARALAALALARRFSPKTAARDELILAFALGYSAHAQRAAARLPPGDPIVAFALDNDRALAREEERDLLGLSLGYQQRAAEWKQWLESLPRQDAFALVTARSAFLARDFEAMRIMPAVVLMRLCLTFTAAAPPDFSDRTLLLHAPQVRAGIDAEARKHTGPWVDPELYSDFYRALWLSAAYRKAEFYREALGSPPAALEFAHLLAEVEDPDLRELERWYGPLVDPQRSAEREPRSSIVGPAQQMETIERIANQKSYDQRPDIDALVSELGKQLDARPARLLTAAYLLRRYYRDAVRAEEFEAHALEANAPHQPKLRARVAARSGDRETLWTMLESASPLLRGAAREQLNELEDPDVDRLAKSFEVELEQRGDDAGLVRGYAWLHAKHRGDPQQAAAILERYLGDHDDGSLTAVGVRAKLARYLRDAGKLESAWHAVEPALPSFKGDVLGEGVYTLMGLDRLDEALALAHATQERYPQTAWTGGLLARVHWRRGEFEEAANALRATPGSSSQNQRRSRFKRDFADAFEGEPVDRVLTAFRALIAAENVEFSTLFDCVREMSARGQLEASFEMAQLLNSATYEFELYLAGYPGLRALRGEGPAAEWMLERITAARLNRAAALIYVREQDELLWNLFNLADTEPNAETWRWRAAAAARDGATAERRRALELHYAGERSSFEDHLGAALLGLEPADALLEVARTPGQVCQAGYALAVRATSEGNEREASRWLQVAAATGSTSVREYGLVQDALDARMSR